jgi:uncharacterized protein YggL (DUF469 family)
VTVLKKRFRKKKHWCEYAKWGRQVVIARTRKDCFNEFLDEFIRAAIEANGCRCVGGGKEDSLDIIVELGRYADDREGKIRSIRSWLDGRSDVAGYRVGPPLDLWHGNCPELPELPVTNLRAMGHPP